MEHDDEVKGENNSYDFGLRMHDPRLGRFFAVDPLHMLFPSRSSYAYAANSPITMIDVLGAGPEDAKKKVNVIITMEQTTYDQLKDTKQSNWVVLKVKDMDDAATQLGEYMKNNNATIENLAFVHHGNDYSNDESGSSVSMNGLWFNAYADKKDEIIKNNNGIAPDNINEQLTQAIKDAGATESMAKNLIGMDKMMGLINKGGTYLSIACHEVSKTSESLEGLSRLGGGGVNMYMNTNKAIISSCANYDVGCFGSIMNQNLTSSEDYLDNRGWLMYDASNNTIRVTNKDLVLHGYGSKAFNEVHKGWQETMNVVKNSLYSKKYEKAYKAKYGADAYNKWRARQVKTLNGQK